MGEGEGIAVDLPSADYYCLAVWKVGGVDTWEAGTYQLRFLPGVTGVPDAPDQDQIPRVTALTRLHPNPFNPQVAIAFDLAADLPVELAVYDLQGRRVRTLVREARPAGRHEVTWTGRDDHGTQVASGVYLVRLAAGGLHAIRKVVLVK